VVRTARETASWSSGVCPGSARPQRDLQGSPLRHSELWEDFVHDAFEQVAQPGERQPRLGLGAAGGQDLVAALPGSRDRRLPQGGLADPRRPLDDQGAWAGRDGGQGGGQLGELGGAAEQHGRHQGLILRPGQPARPGQTWGLPRFLPTASHLACPRETDTIARRDTWLPR
jgi:hypothetical protein